MSKKTPWFDGSVKPVRDGVYERDYATGVFRCLFRDGKWHINSNASSRVSIYQMLRWRGLARKP